MNACAVFDGLNATFAAQDATREALRRHRDALLPPLRATQHALGELHTTRALPRAVLHVAEALRTVGAPLRALEAALPDEAGAYARYAGLWQEQMQACVTAAVVVRMLTDGELVDVEGVRDMVGGEVRIRAEDFVGGVCEVLPILARLCMNRVVEGDFETPGACARFAHRVVEAVGGMDLQNEFLRKRYDGLRGDLKRIEEIMYDLSLRGLTGRGAEPVKRVEKSDGMQVEVSAQAKS